MPRIRGIIDDVRTSLDEDQGLTAVVGATIGAFGAVAIDRYGAAANPETFAITVDQARASLLSALALVFTGLSIVLALTSLTAGNMASKFSPRLLRMKLRDSGNKWVLGTFALTASFIITSQILLRDSKGDTLAPPLMMSISVMLLIVTGVMIVWYINGTLQSLRVDHAIRWTGRRIVRAIRATEYETRRDVIVDALDLERPADAIDLVSSEDGYLIDVDTGRLHRVASDCGAVVVIEAGIGRPVVRGERIGWVSAPSSIDDALRDCITVARARDPETDIGYTVGVLVDIGLMALSPAVNDPRTGVECTDVLTEVFTELARRKVGIRTRPNDDGSPCVVVEAETLGDHVHAAGRQILLYGSDDRTVTAALLRLARQCERVAASDRDRRLCAALADDIEQARASGGQSAGRSS